MAFQLPELPYPIDALAPHISAATLETHYGKHHQGYFEKTNQLARGTRFESMALEDVVRQASGPLFNNAAQAWNHTFYWNSMSPDGGGQPIEDVARALDRSFRGFESFRKSFEEAAVGLFGSGWAWLVRRDDGALEIFETKDADNPLRHGTAPILCCDVWEHAYYLDRKNDREAYVEAWWNVVNWEFAARNLAARPGTTGATGARARQPAG